MSDEVTRAEFQSLQAQLADLIAARDRPAVFPPRDQPSDQAAPAGVPLWYCTYAQGITLTAGIADDWDPRFDVGYDTGLDATTRTRFWLPAPGGCLGWHWIGATGYHRFKFAFSLGSARTVIATLSGSRQDDAAGGYIQVKLNGELFEYFLDSPGGGTAHYNLTLDLKEGPNEIVLCKQFYPHAILFQADLLGADQDQPVDYAKSQGYRY